MHMHRQYKLAGLASVLLAVFVPVAVFAASTVTVNTTESQGWTKDPLYADNRPGGTLEITDTYGAPEGFGTSSLEIGTLTGASKSQLAHPLATPVKLADLNELSYSTYRSSTSTSVPESQLPAINLVIDYNGPDQAGGFSTLVFEPVYQEGGAAAITEDTWQNWDATGDAIWWSTRSIPGAATQSTYVTLNAIKAANPDATISSYIINQGSGNAGLYAAVDAFNFNGTVYNFELKPFKATSKEQCKNDGWRNDFVTVYKNQGDCVSSVASNKN